MARAACPESDSRKSIHSASISRLDRRKWWATAWTAGTEAVKGADVFVETVDLRSLVQIQRIDSDEVPLVSPSQQFFLRENLRLRLLNARLSLLTRDEAGYREDLRAAQAWIQRYFDMRSKPAADALAQLKQLSTTSISFEMPSISESLEAVRGFQLRQSRRSRTPG